MITEEFIKSRPHVFENGVYLFASRYSELWLPKIAVHSSPRPSCPYCDSEYVGSSNRIDGGWAWATYECGVEMAWDNAARGGVSLVLGITPQTAECRFSVFDTTEISTEDII